MLKVWLAAAPLALVVVIGFGLWILVQLLQPIIWVLVLALLSLILAAAMLPIVDAMRKPQLPPGGWRIPKGIAVVIVYLIGGALLALAVYVVGGLLIAELISVSSVLPRTASGFVNCLDTLGAAVGLPPFLLPSTSSLVAEARGIASAVLGASRQVAAGLAQFVIHLFIVLTLALFLVIESQSLLGFWVNLFPSSQRDEVRRLTVRMGAQIGHWVLGQLAVSTIVGTLGWLAAVVLGLPFPVLIGAIMAVVELAPMLGPLIMVIPAFLLGLLQSPLMAVAAGLAYFAIAQLDGNVLSPLITGRAVRLSPVVIIVAIPIGASWYGAIGALIAVPVAAALRVFTCEVLLPWLHCREEGRSESTPGAAGAEHERAA